MTGQKIFPNCKKNNEHSGFNAKTLKKYESFCENQGCVKTTAQCCQIKFLNIHENFSEMFTKSSRQFTYRKLKIGRRRKPSETVVMYGNSQINTKRHLKKDIFLYF